MKNKKLIIRITFSFLIICLLLFSFIFTQFSLSVLLKKGNRFFEFAGRMFPPDFNYLSNVTAPIIETIKMSVAGTFLGTLFAIVTAFLSARNMRTNKGLVIVIRFLVQLIRTIPVLIIALICTFIFGIGTFAGTFSLFIYTWAIMTRIGCEDIETQPMNSYKALECSGCGSIRAFLRTVFIQILPGYLNNALYVLEANIRHAAILGYVGAGGIGLLLNEKISWREYRKVGTILLMLYLVVILLELVNHFLHKYLSGEIKHTKIRSISLISLVIVIVILCIPTISRPNLTQMGTGVVKSILSGIIRPDIKYMLSLSEDGVLFLMLQTVMIAVAGTFLGATISFILSFLSSIRLVPAYIAIPVKLMIMALRTVPIFIYGLMFLRVTGPGSFAGVLTMALCSIGLISKRFTVYIDNMNLDSWMAYKSMGIGWLKRVKYCIMPQLWTQFVAAVLYRFDVNVRSASVLGLVGAGGIGAPLILYMSNYRWDAVGSILIILFIVVLLIDYLSGLIRKNFFNI